MVTAATILMYTTVVALLICFYSAVWYLVVDLHEVVYRFDILSVELVDYNARSLQGKYKITVLASPICPFWYQKFFYKTRVLSIDFYHADQPIEIGSKEDLSIAVIGFLKEAKQQQ